MSDFDLTTPEGIEQAEADLARFEKEVDECVTRDLLPWGLVLCKRRLDIEAARERLKS